MLMLLLVAGAQAFTGAGFGVPEVGGGFAGPYADGPLGLPTVAAAAHPDSIEVAVDAAAMSTRLYYDLDIAPGNVVDNSSTAIVPFLAAAIPLGDFGIGISGYVPMARGGKPGPPDAPQRFHSVSGGYQMLEADLALAWQAHEDWTFGISGRVGRLAVRSSKAMDAGAILRGILGEEAGVPLGDPLREGFQDLPPQSAAAFGGSISFRYAPEDGPKVALSFRTPMKAVLRGSVTVVPSNDLNLVLSGSITTTMWQPYYLFGALELPTPYLSFILDLAWIGWSNLGSYPTEVSGLVIESPDSVMQGILESYGVNEGEFLDAVGGAESVSNMQDSYGVGLIGVLPLFDDQLEVRAATYYNSGAVPESHAHPGNLDFAAVNLRGAVAWTPFRQLTLGVAGDYYYNFPHDITDSLHSITDPTSSGSMLPSGNGFYALGMSRLGLTVVVRQ
jgi:long-subunit fatty acid transport protein